MGVSTADQRTVVRRNKKRTALVERKERGQNIKGFQTDEHLEE